MWTPPAGQEKKSAPYVDVDTVATAHCNIVTISASPLLNTTAAWFRISDFPTVDGGHPGSARLGVPTGAAAGRLAGVLHAAAGRLTGVLPRVNSCALQACA
jgi:hypothetical protein